MATYHDSTQASITTTPNVSVAKPTLSDGDTVFLSIFTRGSVNVATPPSGFTEEADAGGSTGTTASHVRVVTYRRYVATASGEPANYTATMDTNCNGSVVCVSVTGADATNPVQAALFSAQGSNTDAVITAPSVTTTADGALVLSIAAMNTSLGVASWSASGVTEDEDVATVAATSRVSAALGHKTQATAGATTADDWSASLVSGTTYGAGAGVTIAVGIAPVAASAGPDQTVEPGDTVTLDGTATTGAVVSSSWTPDAGNAYNLTGLIKNPTSATATFIAPKPTGAGSMALTFTYEAVGTGNTDTDTVTITVTQPAGASLRVYVLDANGDPT
jgi:hypothetical protein